MISIMLQTCSATGCDRVARHLSADCDEWFCGRCHHLSDIPLADDCGLCGEELELQKFHSRPTLRMVSADPVGFNPIIETRDNQVLVCLGPFGGRGTSVAEAMDQLLVRMRALRCRR